MPSFFQPSIDSVFARVNQVFGTPASYTSPDATQEWEGIVLYADPSALYRMGDVRYEPQKHTAELPVDEIPGLVQRVHEREVQEFITVDGTLFEITAADEIADGRTVKLYITPAT